MVSFLRKGADLERSRLLFHATHTPQFIPLVLSLGANVNQTDENKATPLHIAAHDFNIQSIQLLLAHGAKKSTQNSAGNTPLGSIWEARQKMNDFTNMLVWIRHWIYMHKNLLIVLT